MAVKKKIDAVMQKLRAELEELKQQKNFCSRMIEILKDQEHKEYIVVDELYNAKQNSAIKIEQTEGKAFARATKEHNIVLKDYEKAKANFTHTLKRRRIYEKQCEIILDNINLIREKLPVKAETIRAK